MDFGKRIVPPSKEAQAESDACPHCRGVGTIRARGQRKVCAPCKGTGKKPVAS
jgi:DnaJ-class molecular chaperone